MIYRDIEFVCAGNNGRSPVAEAGGVNMAKFLGYKDEVRISSSGTIADFSLIPDLKTAIQPWLDKAINNCLIGKDRLKTLEQDPKKVLDELVEIETDWRNRYISDSLDVNYNWRKISTALKL